MIKGWEFCNKCKKGEAFTLDKGTLTYNCGWTKTIKINDAKGITKDTTSQDTNSKTIRAKLHSPTIRPAETDRHRIISLSGISLEDLHRI